MVWIFANDSSKLLLAIFFSASRFQIKHPTKNRFGKFGNDFWLQVFYKFILLLSKLLNYQERK